MPASACWWNLRALSREQCGLCSGMPLSLGGADMSAGLRCAAMLLQAEKIKKAFGVASQRAVREAASSSAPPAVVSSSQHEAMSDLLQRVLEL